MLPRLSLLLLVLALTVGQVAGAQSPDASQIATWVEALDADDYFTREEASAALVTAGEPAVAPLAEAAASGDLERAARAIAILGELSKSTDGATSVAAEKALEALAASDASGIITRAKTALRARNELRREAAAATLRKKGAELSFVEGQLDRVILDGEKWRGESEDLALLRWFPETETLLCRDVPISDGDMLELGKLQALRQLHLEKLPITDEGLKAVLQLKRLQLLNLYHLELTGAPLAELSGLYNLQQFHVKYCPIDASVLKGASNCPRLDWFTLYGTKISIEEADQFAAAHPGIRAFDHRGGGLLGVIGIRNIQGCQLEEVRPGMAAAEAGIEVRDVITHFNGQPIQDFDALRALIRPLPAGEKVEIRWQRGGEEMVREVTLSEDNS